MKTPILIWRLYRPFSPCYNSMLAALLKIDNKLKTNNPSVPKNSKHYDYTLQTHEHTHPRMTLEKKKADMFSRPAQRINTRTLGWNFPFVTITPFNHVQSTTVNGGKKEVVFPYTLSPIIHVANMTFFVSYADSLSHQWPLHEYYLCRYRKTNEHLCLGNEFSVYCKTFLTYFSIQSWSIK